MSVSIPPKSRVGQVIGQRYQVLDIIGQGGQSVVYRGLDIRDGDEVALKILKEELARDSDFRERMFREAHAMAALVGTAAVRVMDQQWTADGSLCLVTELLHGRDLDEVLHATEAQGRRLDVATLVSLLDPVVRTLEAAHDKGIVHRDLKPGNIFVIDPARGGGVRLLDFGFAKFTRLRGFTLSGMVAGSPSYIAPEAWKGRQAELDHRIDVYALGAVMYRCLAGQPPFPFTELPSLLKAVVSAERPSLHAFRPDLPPAIDDWVQQALAIEPTERFLRCRALWAAFRSLVGN